MEKSCYRSVYSKHHTRWLLSRFCWSWWTWGHYLKQKFSGIPDTVVSDNGTPFSSQKFHEFLRSCKFNHVTSKANGKAESSVRTVKHLFKEAERDGKDPLLALLDYGNNHTEGLGTSPSQRLMSRRTRNLLPAAASLPRPEIIPDSTEQLEGKGERPSFTMTVLQNSCLKLNSCKRIKRGNRLLA